LALSVSFLEVKQVEERSSTQTTQGCLDPQVESFLESGDAYPHHVDSVRVEETHISEVFLTGPFAYKVKKPVDLGFLDFTTLEKRKHFCERELVLNQRLSQDVYLDVVKVTRDGGDLALEGSGEPIEYAVKMKQLPKEATM
jgi:aminoglycoside phosphotransferase family enzyme